MVEALTVGHGATGQDELAHLLLQAGVHALVDVRIAPGSRRNPHVMRAALAQWLPAAGIAYRWDQRLGGYRKLPPDSPDLALRNSSFRAYAAHMRELHARRYDTVRAAYEEGVPVYVGTDAGGSLPHGLVASEVAELVAAGLPRIAALSAASWGARRWLGRPGLEEGASADLVVYPDDPREDVGVLAHPTAVVLRGRVW